MVYLLCQVGIAVKQTKLEKQTIMMYPVVTKFLGSSYFFNGKGWSW